jgi:fatty acid amide hydrolase 2
MRDLLLSSATAIARAIRARELTSAEAVEAHVAQIERVNPVLNAVVRTRFDEARAEAARADELRARTPASELPPLHGVPCTIKECFALTGMPNASGLVARRSVITACDATAVARLRAAGAIPLGVTNTSELCMWMESDNRVYGRTNNPYDPGRIVGGSSGGEGAIVGAAGSPFGLGSDVGGSIRAPAFFNGVFGHKPTGGMVPGTGQYPIAAGDGLRYLTTGPIARRAEDLMPLLRILAGPDGLDAQCRHFELGDPGSVHLAGRTLLDVPDNGALRIAPELRAAQERGLRALEERGMRVRRASFAGLRKQFDVWSAMMAEAQAEPFAEMLGEGRRVRPALEILKHGLGRSDYTLVASLLALVDPLPKLLPSLSRRTVELGRRLRAEVADALGPDGVLLYPSYTVPAPRHGEPVRWLLRMHHPWAYWAIFNVLELPATQVPAGLSADGLPLGFQVVSASGNDHVTIAVALELERALGGWTPPRLAGLAGACGLPPGEGQQATA